MLQQILAIIIVFYFVFRSAWLWRKKEISKNEFAFWVLFWVFAGSLILFIKRIDLIVSGLGFSATGIDILVYLVIPILFYLIFRLRIRLYKIEKDITKIVREVAIKNK